MALFALSIVVGTTTIAHAELSPAEIENNYGKYLNLFNASSVLTQGTGGLYIKDVTSNNVVGLKLNINLKTIAPQTSSENPWNFIETPSTFGAVEDDEVFLIRICDNSKTNCWVTNIPYRTDPKDFVTITRTNNNGVFNFSQSLQDYPVLSTKTAIGTRVASGPNGVSSSVFANNYKYARTITDGKNEGQISNFASNGVVIPKSSTVEVTLWYCANNTSTFTGETAYSTIGNGFNDKIATFGDLCDGQTYFRIGEPFMVTTPADQTSIDNNVNTSTSTTKQNDDSTGSNLPSCGIIPGQTGTIVGCLAQLVHYGIYWPITWIAGLFGSLFDFFIGYSVSDESYRYAFAVTGWKLVRDIANIMFIIIMIYTGFAAVFDFGGKGGSTLKRVVPFLIINALIINFSLFATRTVIDISNITARVFYSRMIVCYGPCGPNLAGTNIPENVKRGLGGHWPLSEKIVSAFDPQKMFKANVLEPKEQALSTQTDSLNATAVGRGLVDAQKKGFDKSSSEYAGYYAIVSLLASIIMLFIGIMFFKVMFMFLGRVVGLYMAMIFSPFAFLTLNGGGGFFNIKGYDWGTWSKNLFNYAALAPIFVFFLYIIYSFINTDMVAQIGLKDSGGFFATLLTIAVPMLIIYALVDQGAKMAAKYAGEFGMMAQNTLSKVAGMAGGVALGVASGGAALAGTTLGARAGRAIGNTRLGAWAASNSDDNRAARFFNNTLSKTQTGSWDFRNTGLNKLVNTGVTKVTGGVKLDDRVTERLGMSAKDFAGGAVALRKKREDKIKKSFDDKLQFSHLSDDRAKELWKQHQNKKASKIAMHEHALETDAEYKTATDEVAAKKKELDAKRKEIADAREKLITENSTITTSDRATLKMDIRNAKEKEAEIQKNILLAKEKQEARLIDVKSKTDKNGAAYQSKVAAAITTQEEKDKKTYGTIEKSGEFANAMRRDYVEEKRNNSLWMKDGEQRAGLWGIPLGGAGAGVLAAGLSAISGGVGAVFGSVIADRVKFEQETFDAATKSYMKDYGKKKGKDSKAEQLSKRIRELDDLINEKVADKSGKTKDEAKKMDRDDKQTHFEEYVIDMEVEFKEADALLKNAEIAFRGNPTDTSLRSAMTTAVRNKKKSEDALNKAKNAWKDKEKADTDLEKEDEKNNPKP